ncbi:hypothetical protein LGL55_24715 [Clostridium tagluense]|nr:hypothetical protein [Clostridium tagluense]MCB2323976.1 hypothetical protein [Clostridium tagluense]MCB2338569.1 hypothetical protein [Clostridium tagluense]MCB2367371.1 hypothetical protein [Clostridium tagluense]
METIELNKSAISPSKVVLNLLKKDLSGIFIIEATKFSYFSREYKKKI